MDHTNTPVMNIDVTQWNFLTDFARVTQVSSFTFFIFIFIFNLKFKDL